MRHIKQSNYASRFIRAEHCNMYRSFPLYLISSVKLTPIEMKRFPDRCQSNWVLQHQLWVCNLAPCLPLPLCLAWHCKNVMALKWRHKCNPCLFFLFSTTQCKRFLGLVNALACTLIYVSTVDSVCHHCPVSSEFTLQLLCRAPQITLIMAGVSIRFYQATFSLYIVCFH